jgi:putative cardiolipin synthase
MNPQAKPAPGRLAPLGFWLLFGAFCLTGCASLPKRAADTGIHGVPDTSGTSWSRVLAPAVAEHPDKSGVELLMHAQDALAARLALADTAECSLDVQYYIWERDEAGRLLFEHLLRAADRGVHVRLLLDDVGVSASDTTLLAVDSHTNIEVRLFNPLAGRNFRMLSLLTDYRRANRRMHNKSFTVDRHVTIVGGRNVGDRYYAAGEQPHFADFDVLAAGPAAEEVAAMFDRYWWSSSSRRIRTLVENPAAAELLGQMRAELDLRVAAITNSTEFADLDQKEVATRISEHRPALVWGSTSLVYDLPEKITTDEEDVATHIMPKLRRVADETQREIFLVSPYFVPGKRGVAFFQSLRQRGVRVVVLANSLASNDVLAVHAGYRRYRKPLLRAGVELYELKPTAYIRDSDQDDKRPRKRRKNVPGSSLHAKAFIFDHSTLFVGSLNLDPRSSSLNTEMGLLMEIPELARPTADALEASLAENAYRLQFVPGPGPCKECGSIVWLSQENGQVVRYTREPKTSFVQRLMVTLISILPIESQL